MNKKVLVGLFVALVVLVVAGFIFYFVVPESLPPEEKQEITSLVEGFGKKLVSVDKVAPDDIVSRNIKEAYSPYLSDNLVLEWTFDPAKALGRVCSSPWPDRIEILSMKKLDTNTVKVKGYVVWVASGGENKLEITEKVPVVLILLKDPSTQKFLIDKAFSNEHAFYDGKELLKTLKEAFPDMNIIGERYEPYVAEKIYIVSSSMPVTIVDMGTGGAYTEYYTVCIPSNGKLEVANFKDKDGKIAPLFFDEGASVKHEVKLRFESDSSAKEILYQSIVERDESGEVSNVEVEAYGWNAQTKVFEYSKEFSEEIKHDLEKQLTPKTVSLSSLKFKEIKSEFPAIGNVAVYNGKIAFSCGSEKNRVNEPSGTINHISLYDIKQSKIEYSIQVTKDWANIDQIEMNDNWILFKVVENDLGAPVECFAINRKTHKIETVVPIDFEGYYVVVNKIALFGDYAFVSMDVFNKMGTPNEVFAKDKSLGDKLVRLDLNSGKVLTIFDGTQDKVSVSLSGKTTDYIVSIEEPTTSSKKTPSSVLCLWNEKSGIKLISNVAQYVVACTPDNYIVIINETLKEIGLANVSEPDKISYISSYNNIDVNNIVTSNDYIVFHYEDEKGISEVTNNDGGISMLIPKFIRIFNRKENKMSTIHALSIVKASLDGSTLCLLNHSEGNMPDSIILLDLEENSF